MSRKFELMKTITTTIAILLVSTLFSQSNVELVQYEVNAHKMVNILRVSVDEGQSYEANQIGQIQCIDDSLITLELNPHLNYSLFVNNKEVINITREEIAAFNFEKDQPFTFTPNTSSIVSNEGGESLAISRKTDGNGLVPEDEGDK